MEKGDDCLDKALAQNDNHQIIEDSFILTNRKSGNLENNLFQSELIDVNDNELHTEFDVIPETKCPTQLRLNLEVAEETSFILEDKIVLESNADVLNLNYVEPLYQTTDHIQCLNEINELISTSESEPYIESGSTITKEDGENKEAYVCPKNVTEVDQLLEAIINPLINITISDESQPLPLHQSKDQYAEKEEKSDNNEDYILNLSTTDDDKNELFKNAKNNSTENKELSNTEENQGQVVLRRKVLILNCSVQ